MECLNHCAIGRLMVQWFQQNNHTSVSGSCCLIGRYEHGSSPLLVLQDNASVLKQDDETRQSGDVGSAHPAERYT